jgi:hypothetical protein
VWKICLSTQTSMEWRKEMKRKEGKTIIGFWDIDLTVHVQLRNNIS